MVTTGERFSGSKVALFLGDKLLVTLRDDRPDIPCPNMWDFPGGGVEGAETPFQTLAREVREEVGLLLTPRDILWEKRYDAVHSSGWVMFYVARLPAARAADIVFGDEGQGWRLVTIDTYLGMTATVPSLPPRLRDWIAETGGTGGQNQLQN